MEQVIDKLIEEIRTLSYTDSINGGISDILPLVDVKFDDPGLVLFDDYPYAFVAPVLEEPRKETMGRAGYDIRSLLINVVFVVNSGDYFDPSASQASGSRELVQASSKLRAWLRRLGKRNLDGLAGVRNLVVQSTNYTPDIRGDAFVRTAITTLIVERQYQHEQ